MWWKGIVGVVRVGGGLDWEWSGGGVVKGVDDMQRPALVIIP